MRDLLKFITCGSVDDGKSTLIGHILYDSKLLYADQEKALQLDSKVGSREGAIDYSLLLDGLTEEREQGITIDVAYRYFTTDRRSFIVADTPGHEEYTRNMAVGASFADLAVILIDAKQGVLVQTRRHARICTLMGIRHFVFAVNKMDLVDYSGDRFLEITEEVDALSSELGIEDKLLIPVSATEGDNVTKHSENMEWYKGPTLLDYLETIDINTVTEEGFVLPVQRVSRPNHTFRGFQGQIESGSVAVGEEIRVLPSDETAKVKSILIGDKEADTAVAGQPVTVQLDREVDVSRGCVLVSGTSLTIADSVTATVLWMDETPLTPGKNVFVKLGTRQVPGIVSRIQYAVDVNTGEHKQVSELSKNEIALCKIVFTEKVVADLFRDHRALGELILIDRVTFQTSACGVVEKVGTHNAVHAEGPVTPELRAILSGQTPVTVEFRIGKNGVTRALAEKIEKQLTVLGRHAFLYQPEKDEPFEAVVPRLNEAGLIVLLLLDPETADEHRIPAGKAYLNDWGDLPINADALVSYIKEISVCDPDSSDAGDNI